VRTDPGKWIQKIEIENRGPIEYKVTLYKQSDPDNPLNIWDTKKVVNFEWTSPEMSEPIALHVEEKEI
jgi:hypothetical protein